MADPDRYHRDLLALEFRMRSQQGKFISSTTQKQLHRMGDAAAIGLLKTVTLAGMRGAEKVHACVSMIEESFSFPELIAADLDRRPDVSMLLLNAMMQSSDDPVLSGKIRTLMQKLSSESEGPPAGQSAI